MSDHTRASRCAFALTQSNQASFDNMPKHLWDEEVVRIIKASKGSQRRLAEWAPELNNVHLPVAASRAASRAFRSWTSRTRSLSSLRHSGTELRVTPGKLISVDFLSWD